LKKKLNNRRLDYDAKLNKMQKNKRDKPEYEEDTKAAHLKYQETLSDLTQLMHVLNEREVTKTDP
jgi:BAR domain